MVTNLTTVPTALLTIFSSNSFYVTKVAMKHDSLFTGAAAFWLAKMSWSLPVEVTKHALYGFTLYSTETGTLLMVAILVWSMKTTIWIKRLLLQFISCLLHTSQFQEDEQTHAGLLKCTALLQLFLY